MYKLIVARNSVNGIGLQGTLPWKANSEDMAFFKAVTINHVVIMGRGTWESLPGPLSNRINIILTSKADRLELPAQCFAFKSIKACDTFVRKEYPERIKWVIGGEAVYNAYLEKELVSEVAITEFLSAEPCDRYFNWFSNGQTHGFCRESSIALSSMCVCTIYTKQNKEELRLQNAMSEIIERGMVRSTRTGVATRSVFGRMFEYVMEEKVNPATGTSMYRLPLLTSKRMFTRGVFGELKWFLNGRVDSKELERDGINIWKGNTSRAFLDQAGLIHHEEGETGPIYGFQWRHWGAAYAPGQTEYSGQGIDQVARVIDSLQTDPFSRRHVISGWNVSDLDQMCLPPCFPAGTLVPTRDGYKEIQQLTDIDQVLTHLGTWKPIINRQIKSYSGALYSISHVGSAQPISATKEHPFLVKMIRIDSVEPLTYKLSEETSWVPADQLEADRHVLCVPIVQEERPVSITVVVDGQLTIPPPIDYFMVGVYVGRQGNTLDLQFIPPGWSVLKQFSKYTDGNACDCIPEWVQALPKIDLGDFVRGFEAAATRRRDSYLEVPNGEVALSMQRIYAKLGIPVRVLSEGGAVIRKLHSDMDGRCYADNSYLYLPVVKITSKATAQTVYNLEVADDNSYVVENVATHNCHMLYQFMVHEHEGQKYLSLMMTQRSCDTFLGLPFNLASLGMFLFLMATTVDMKPHKIIHSIADMHIYETHIEAACQQTQNQPYAFPYIQLRPGTQTKTIEQYEYSDIKIVDYFCHDAIQADMVA